MVVWGHVIQANSLLFSPGAGDCPGEVVFSLDQARPINRDELGSTAAALAALKHTKPADPDLASIADYLTNETTRVFGRPVPAGTGLPPGCKISTVYFVRKHLPAPNRCLEQLFVPIIVHPEPPFVALVLPSRYWPPALVEWWRREPKRVLHNT